MDYTKLRCELFELMKSSYYKSPAVNYSEFFQGELKMLNLLDGFDGESLTPSDLCKRLYMTSARIAAALKSAEKKGYVKRTPSLSDKRSVTVSITESGRVYVSEKLAKLNRDFEYFLVNLGERDASEFVRLVKRISEISEKRTKGDN